MGVKKKKKRPKRAGFWRWAGRLLLLVLFLSLFPALQVGISRWVNPVWTPMMAQRWIEARVDARPPPGRRIDWLPLGQIPDSFLHFVWISEDQRFFTHDGIDFVELRNSIERAKKTGGPPRGSSTITMQAARSAYLWQGRSYLRKALEAYYTLWMELLLGKDRILEIYANVIEMGPGVYGIGAAAEYWYDRRADELSRSQTAMLVAILPAPLTWSPREPTPRVLARQRIILDRAARQPFPEDKLQE